MSGDRAKQKRAAVVGINSYPLASGLLPLKYAEADTGAVAERLRHFGFQTELLLGPQATRDHLEEALLEGIRDKGDVFIFYFAGHGQLIGGSLVLHPVDSKRGGQKALGFLQCYRTWHSDSGYQKILAILDACRYELGGARGPVTCTPETTRDIQALATQGQGRVEVLYGCSEGQVSYEDDGLRHGVFTRHLLQAFDMHPNYLDSDILSGETVDLMRDWCRQDPMGRFQTAHRYYEPLAA